ncbi:MAG: GxGYxYP domain-containing protein, partial [Nitrososphaerales archaeon]
MKKLLMGGALLGSAVMFGNVLSPMLSRKVTADTQNSIIANTTQVSNLLPKPARHPTTLHVGSIHDGTASLQLAVIAGILARNQPQIYLTDSSFVDNNLEQSLSKHYGVTFNKSSNTAKLVSQFGNQACGSPARWIRFNNSHGGSTLAQNEAVDQLNAVRTLCGVYDALPVPAGQTPPI